MRVLLVVFSCVASTLHAAVIKKNDSEIQLDDACLIDYGIEPEAISDGSQELTYEQVYCVAACIYKNKRIMNSDGTINEEVVNSHFTDEDDFEKELFYSLYKACKAKTNCELVQCMFENLKSQLESDEYPEDTNKDFPPDISRRFFPNSIFKF